MMNRLIGGAFICMLLTQLISCNHRCHYRIGPKDCYYAEYYPSVPSYRRDCSEYYENPDHYYNNPYAQYTTVVPPQHQDLDTDYYFSDQGFIHVIPDEEGALPHPDYLDAENA